MTSLSPALTVAPAARAAQRRVLAGLSLCMLLSSLGTSIANVGLPALAQAFDAPFRHVQGVVIAYLAALTLLSAAVGRLGDALGRARLLRAGTLLFMAASLLCGLAPSLGVLIGARALQGLGAAAMMALSMALVGDTLPKDRAGAAMGLLGTMSSVGTALGPSLGGALIALSGWRASFLLLVPAAALAAWWVHRGVAAMPAVRATSRAAAAWRQRALWPGLVMAALVSMVMITTLIVGPFHLARALGLSPAWVGLVMSAGPVVAALCGVPAGRWVDRFGAPRLVVAGLIGMATGLLLLALLPASVVAYGVPLVITTAGYATFQTANNTAVMALAGAAQRGVVSGMLSMARNLGLVGGASVMGAVFAWATAADVATAAPAAVAAGMRCTFGVAATAVGVALVVALRHRWLTR